MNRICQCLKLLQKVNLSVQTENYRGMRSIIFVSDAILQFLSPVSYYRINIEKMDEKIPQLIMNICGCIMSL